MVYETTQVSCGYGNTFVDMYNIYTVHKTKAKRYVHVYTIYAYKDMTQLHMYVHTYACIFMK